MPRIPPVTDPRGAPGVVPVPLNRALRSPLTDLGTALSQSGGAVAQEVIRRERSAADTRLKTKAAELYGELDRDIDEAGTAAEARSIYDQRAPQIAKELEREADRLGLPEAKPGLALIGARTKASALSTIGKRSQREELDAAQLFSSQYEQRLTNARTAADFKGLRAELSLELERVAEDNPLLSPADAQGLLNQVVQSAAKGRALNAVRANIGDPQALRAMQETLTDPERFPDLSTSDAGALVEMAGSLADQEENRRWRALQREEVLRQRAMKRLQLDTMQGHAGTLAEEGDITDGELFADVAAGRLSPAGFRFITQLRDQAVAETFDLGTYQDLRAAAEVGLLEVEAVENALADGAFGSGSGAISIARDLIDLAESAERQGGIFRRADFKEAEDLVSVALRGVRRDEPLVILEDPGDPKAQEFVQATTRARRIVLELLDSGTEPDQLNPFAIYGRVLRDVGATRPRPEPNVIPGPLPDLAGTLSTLSAEEIENRLIPTLRQSVEREASKMLGDEAEARDQLGEAKRYLGALRRWESSNRAAEALINAVPPEGNR